MSNYNITNIFHHQPTSFLYNSYDNHQHHHHHHHQQYFDQHQQQVDQFYSQPPTPPYETTPELNNFYPSHNKSLFADYGYNVRSQYPSYYNGKLHG